jgi:hypothetical protein
VQPPRWAGRAVRLAFLVLVLVAIVLTLRSQGSELRSAIGRTGIAATLGSFAAVLVGLFASAMVWRELLADLGSRLPLRTALHVFFLGQLGKYLPGSVFAVAAQMELGRDQGVSRSRVGTASLLFMGVLTAGGLLVAAVALPLTSPDALQQYFWVLLVLPVGLVCLAPPVLTRLVATMLRLLRRDPLERPLSARGIGAALGWTLAMWIAYGAHLWLLVLPQVRQPSTGEGHLLLLSLGAYALAWTVGFLFLLAPAGALIRETVLVLALAGVLDRPAATAVAVVSRGVMTLGDLAWGAAGGALRPRAGPKRTPGGADVATVTPVKQLGKAADA